MNILWNGNARFEAIEKTDDSYTVRKFVTGITKSGGTREAFIDRLREQVLADYDRSQIANVSCNVIGVDIETNAQISKDSVELLTGKDPLIPIWFWQINGLPLESLKIITFSKHQLGGTKDEIKAVIKSFQEANLPESEFSQITITLTCINWSTNEQVSFDFWNA